jgi:pyruvate-formate lyase-activating enzyme
MIVSNISKVGYFYLLDYKRENTTDISFNELSIDRNFIERIDKNKSSYIESEIGIIPHWILDENNFNKYLDEKFSDILPMTAEIIPTLVCPFRCEQCSYKPQKQRMGIWENTKNVYNMSSETMSISLTKLKEVNTKNIVITGGGEPLANKNVSLEGIELAKSFHMNVCLYSNALLLSEDISKKICLNGLDYIRISIYGFCEDDFTQYTNSKAKNYNIIFENLRNLIIQKRTTNSNIVISLSFLLHPKMKSIIKKDSIKNMFNLLKQKIGEENLPYISTIRLTPAVDYYNNNQHSEQFFSKCFEDAEQVSKQFQSEGVIVRPYYHRLIDLYRQKDYSTCRGCGLYAEIGVDGSMYQCCEKLFEDKFNIGNLNSESIIDIFKSKQRKSVCDNVNGNIRYCPTLCKPHEINKKLASFINLSKKDKLRINFWRDNIIRLKNEDNKPFHLYNPFES